MFSGGKNTRGPRSGIRIPAAAVPPYRGMEFATQPYDLTRREVIQANSMFDTPTYRWLPAKSEDEEYQLPDVLHAHTGRVQQGR